MVDIAGDCHCRQVDTVSQRTVASLDHLVVTTSLLKAIGIANPVVEVIDGLLDRILLHIGWPNDVFLKTWPRMPLNVVISHLNGRMPDIHSLIWRACAYLSVDLN